MSDPPRSLAPITSSTIASFAPGISTHEAAVIPAFAAVKMWRPKPPPQERSPRIGLVWVDRPEGSSPLSARFVLSCCTRLLSTSLLRSGNRLHRVGMPAEVERVRVRIAGGSTGSHRRGDSNEDWRRVRGPRGRRTDASPSSAAPTSRTPSHACTCSRSKLERVWALLLPRRRVSRAT